MIPSQIADRGRVAWGSPTRGHDGGRPARPPPGSRPATSCSQRGRRRSVPRRSPRELEPVSDLRNPERQLGHRATPSPGAAALLYAVAGPAPASPAWPSRVGGRPSARCPGRARICAPCLGTPKPVAAALNALKIRIHRPMVLGGVGAHPRGHVSANRRFCQGRTIPTHLSNNLRN
jgi:hypothetical protein